MDKFGTAVAFCQGLAFDLCVSGTERPHGEEPKACFAKPLAPSALNTRALRSWFISRSPRLTESLTKTSTGDENKHQMKRNEVHLYLCKL